MAMPVIQSAPAVERSGSVETVAYGQNPEPAKQLFGLFDEAADLGRNFLAKERARRSRSPAVASQSSSCPQTSRSTWRAMDQLGLEVGADMAAKQKADAAKSIVKGTKGEPDRGRDAPPLATASGEPVSYGPSSPAASTGEWVRIPIPGVCLLYTSPSPRDRG